MKILDSDKFHFEQLYTSNGEACHIPNEFEKSCIDNIKEGTCKCAIEILQGNQDFTCQKAAGKLWYGPLSEKEKNYSSDEQEQLIDDFQKKFKERGMYISIDRKEPKALASIQHKAKEDGDYLYIDIWRDEFGIKNAFRKYHTRIIEG